MGSILTSSHVVAVPVKRILPSTSIVITISAFDTFTSYREAHNRFMSKYNEHELFASHPERILFSIKALREVKAHSYAPLVASLLSVSKGG